MKKIFHRLREFWEKIKRDRFFGRNEIMISYGQQCFSYIYAPVIVKASDPYPEEAPDNLIPLTKVLLENGYMVRCIYLYMEPYKWEVRKDDMCHYIEYPGEDASKDDFEALLLLQEL